MKVLYGVALDKTIEECTSVPSAKVTYMLVISTKFNCQDPPLKIHSIEKIHKSRTTLTPQTVLVFSINNRDTYKNTEYHIWLDRAQKE